MQASYDRTPAFDQHVADLLSLPELRSSRERAHHFDLSEYDHLMLVAQHAHRLSLRFGQSCRPHQVLVALDEFRYFDED